jgi:hypothetical protein
MAVKQISREKMTKKSKEDIQPILPTTLPMKRVSKLPSNFLSYPAGTEISYVPYTFGELLTFSQSTMDKYSKFEFILKGIYTNGIEKHNLAFFDFIYISLLRKLSSFKDDTLIIQYNCAECGAQNSVVEQLTNLKFQELNVPGVPIVIKDDDGGELHFVPLTIGAYMNLWKRNKLEDPLEMYASVVANLPPEKSKAIIDKATGDLSMAISYADDALVFGLEPVILNCSECGTPNVLEMEDPEIYISPFRSGEGLIGSRISFGISA